MTNNKARWEGMDRHVFQLFSSLRSSAGLLTSVPRKCQNSVLSGSDEQLGCLCLAASLLYGASLTFLLSSTCLCEQSTDQECPSVSLSWVSCGVIYGRLIKAQRFTPFWSVFCSVTIIWFDLDWDQDLFLFVSNYLCSWITFCYCSELLLSVFGEFSPQKS